MDDVGIDSEALGEGQVDGVPGEADIAGDVKILADRRRVAEQPDKGPGEILGARERPDRRAVTRNEHGLARQHAVAHRVAFVEHGGKTRARGVRGTHIGPGQIAPLHQILAGDLGLAVGPVGIDGGRRLGGHVGEGMLLVDRSRGDEDVLAGATGEDVDVLLHLWRGEHQELRHHIPIGPAQLRVGRGIGHVAGDGGDARRQGRVALAAIEDRDLVAGFDRAFDTRQRDLPRAADEQDLERHRSSAGFGGELSRSGAIAQAGCRYSITWSSCMISTPVSRRMSSNRR
jgi:hypothetical protein